MSRMGVEWQRAGGCPAGETWHLRIVAGCGVNQLPGVTMNCAVCGGPVEVFGTQAMLARHLATYVRCTRCGFMQVPSPTWLDEAYASAVAGVDIGTIQRMIRCSRLLKVVLHCFLRSDGRYLDYGAGYGAFVRHMRDLGYDFRWYDAHCENIFAKNFVGDLDTTYDAVTAIELFEHFVDPMTDIGRLAKLSDHIAFTTSLIGDRPPPLNEWAYYAPETGQHIAFYTPRALQIIGESLGMHFYTDGSDFHLLSRSRLSARRFTLLTGQRVRRLLVPFLSRRTLLYRDFHQGRLAATAVSSDSPPSDRTA